MRLSVYHYPMVMYIKAEDPDLPAFYYDNIVQPMPPVNQDLRTAGVSELTQEELDEFELPEEVEPFLSVILFLISNPWLVIKKFPASISDYFQGVWNIRSDIEMSLQTGITWLLFGWKELCFTKGKLWFTVQKIWLLERDNSRVCITSTFTWITIICLLPIIVQGILVQNKVEISINWTVFPFWSVGTNVFSTALFLCSWFDSQVLFFWIFQTQCILI